MFDANSVVHSFFSRLSASRVRHEGRHLPTPEDREYAEGLRFSHDRWDRTIDDVRRVAVVVRR